MSASGTMYRVDGPQISRETEYSTLKRAKQVAEELCRFSEQNPIQMIPIDLRNYPNSGVQIIGANGVNIYHAETTVCKEFIPPPF